MKITICKDYQSISQQAAQHLAKQIIRKPDSVLGLATGSTPEGMYQQLIRYYQVGLISFEHIRTVNLDEYVGLPPTHEQSYHYFMHEKLFNHVNIKPNNIHLLDGLADDTTSECQQFDQRVQALGGIDCQILGIGANGHIGFNEPCHHFSGKTRRIKLDKQTTLDNSRFFNHVDEVPKYALTMGLKSIMQSKSIILLAGGEKKAKAVAETMQGDIHPELPASILQLHPNVRLIIDEQAASLL